MGQNINWLMDYLKEHNLLAATVVSKQEKEREFLPALAFTASLECGGKGMGGGGCGPRYQLACGWCTTI